MLKVQPIESVNERIRQEFAERGNGLSASAFAQHCIDAGFWESEDLDSFTLKEASRIVKAALNKHDRQGLPFAGETTEQDDDGAPVWKQRTFWNLETYGVQIEKREKRAHTELAEAALLRKEALERFGVLPFSASAAD